MNARLLAAGRVCLPLFVGSALAAGCSGPSEPGPDDSEPQTVVEAEQSGVAIEVPDTATADPVIQDPVVTVPVEEAPLVSDPEMPEAPEPVVVDPVRVDPVAADPVVPDPMTLVSTQVEFDITVPAYVSNALRVRVEWNIAGEPDSPSSLRAAWTGDEFWAASADLPTDTEHRLVVTFFDDNGDIVLGTVDTAFTTGTNASESVSIGADQFDTTSSDDDGDGQSNLSELIAGTDPLVDELVLLDVRERFSDGRVSYGLAALSRVSASYESSIPRERPFSENIEREQLEDCLSGRLGPPVSRIVDIDANGTGSFAATSRCTSFGDNTVEQRIGSRTRVNGSVMWEGSYFRSNSSAAVSDSIEFTTETAIVDNSKRRQSGSINRTFFQSFGSSQSISYDLIGQIADDSDGCEPISGTITIDDQSTTPIVTFAISKEEDDRYWHVTVIEENRTLDEYLLASLDRTFFCDVGE